MSAPTVTEPTVVTRHVGMTKWITLNCPQSLNAMTDSMAGDIDAALTEAEADDGTRCIAITGTGRAFCVGANLKSNHQAAGNNPEEATLSFIARYNDLLNRLEAYEKPVFAVVNGIALGAGTELALCCDGVFASSTAKIGDGHAKFGLIPGGGGSARLPRKIGTAAAKLMMFTGDFLDAEECMRVGLVERVLPDDRLHDTAQGIFDTITSRSPLCVRVMKTLANAAPAQTLDAALTAEMEAFKAHLQSADRAEGLAAFAEKRKPEFRGN